MRLTRRTLLGAAAMTVAMRVAPAVAQGTPEGLLTQLDGLKTARARKYLADRALGFATPVVADAATPDVLTVTVLEFETAEDVTAAFGMAMNPLVARMILGNADLELAQRSLDGLGDMAVAWTGERELSDGPQQVALLAVRDGNLGFLLSAWGPDVAMLGTVEGVARFMVAAEPSDAPVVVEEYGASGGTFDLMPGRDDAEVLHGLVPMYDYDLLLDGGEEPLGHDHAGEATPAG